MNPHVSFVSFSSANVKRPVIPPTVGFEISGWFVIYPMSVTTKPGVAPPTSIVMIGVSGEVWKPVDANKKRKIMNEFRLKIKCPFLFMKL